MFDETVHLSAHKKRIKQMTKKEKKELETMLCGFESVLDEFDRETDPVSIGELLKRISNMDNALSMASFEIREA
jgi:hypothetical protein